MTASVTRYPLDSGLRWADIPILVEKNRGTSRLSPGFPAATTNIAQTPLVPATYTIPGGEWRINWYMSTFTPCPLETVQLTISFTDDTAARTTPLVSVSMGATGPTNQGGGTFIVYAASGTSINYSTAVMGCTTTLGSYNLRLTAEQIQ
jgi:hypothetical protein